MFLKEGLALRADAKQLKRKKKKWFSPMINDFNLYWRFLFFPKDNLIHSIICYKFVKLFIKHVFIGFQLFFKKKISPQAILL